MQSRNTQNLPGVILLNAGLIHRVGPARFYVRLARRLEKKGLTTLRFDHSGIGDSSIRRDNLPFWTSAVVEVQEVMNGLQEQNSIDQFVLMGICSGATTAFNTASIDDRVVGIVMMNAQGYDPNQNWNLYVMNRYDAKQYRGKFFSFRSWKRIFTGQTQYQRFIKIYTRRFKNLFLRRRELSSIADRLALQMQNLIERKIRMLMIYSEGDRGLDYLQVILGNHLETMLSSSCIHQEVIPGSDHTFTLLRNQESLFGIIEDWFMRSFHL
jgi:pimeloyl-ACP methyl ester carboxylesterase